MTCVHVCNRAALTLSASMPISTQGTDCLLVRPAGHLRPIRSLHGGRVGNQNGLVLVPRGIAQIQRGGHTAIAELVEFDFKLGPPTELFLVPASVDSFS